MTVSKSSSVILSTDLSRRTPALVTRMSNPPKASKAPSMRAVAASVVPTPTTTAVARPPAAVMDSTAA